MMTDSERDPFKDRLASAYAALGLATTTTGGASHPRPTFLIGCHRSGTTLLRYLLDSHPRICCPPESKFVAALASFVGYPQAMAGLASLGVDREQVLLGIRTFIETVMGTHAEKQGKSRWIDKTPNYFKILEFIDEVFQQQPRYVFLVRHPCDTIASLMEAQCFMPPVEDPDVAESVNAHGHGEEAFAHYWDAVYRTLSAFAALNSDRTQIVAYEVLVRQPEESMADILTFIGDSYVDGLVQNALLQPHKVGFQDWKIRHTSNVHARSVGRSRTWSPNRLELVWSIVGATAGSLGYSANSPFPSTAAHWRGSRKPSP